MHALMQQLLHVSFVSMWELLLLVSEMEIPTACGEKGVLEKLGTKDCDVKLTTQALLLFKSSNFGRSKHEQKTLREVENCGNELNTFGFW
jgi:hypothetical protein